MRLLVIYLAILVAACKGEAGPTGAAGTNGAAGQLGPSGPGTRLWQKSTVVVTGSMVSFDLPAAAGSTSNPPVWACYQLTAYGWLPANQSYPGQCALSQSPTTGNLSIQVTAPYNTQVMVVVVY